VLKKLGKYSHLSTKKANVELYPVIKLLLNNLDVDKAAKIAAFYDFSREELEFLVGERAKEIAEYIERHRLHRVEDETFLGLPTTDDVAERLEPGVTKEKEKREMDKRDQRRRKKGKDLTLDSFFS